MADQVPTADNDVPIDDDQGPNPEDALPAEPADDTPPPTDGDDDSSPDDQQAAGTEDEESEEWRYLADRFKNIEDPKERRAAIGKAYLEKTRFASEIRRENEELREELAKHKGTEPPKDEPPAEPPEKHQDVQRLDARITKLQERGRGYSERQDQVLADLRGANDELAVAKDRLASADEADRAAWEREIRAIERHRGSLTSAFQDLAGRIDDITDSLSDLDEQRQWTIRALTEQRSRQTSERQSEAQFQKDFPADLESDMNEMADELGIPKDKDTRQDLKETVFPRLATAFWKAERKGATVGQVDLEGLVTSEVKRFRGVLERAGKVKFKKESDERIAASRDGAPARPPARRDGGTPPQPRTPQRRNPLVPVDVTALGVQDEAPSMARGRKHLADHGF